MTYRVLSLFAGIGGFDLGLERTGGFKTVAFCEIDPFCQKVLAKHWPGVPIYDDVRTLTAERLASDGIAVDCIVGGFPCQDISLANNRGAGLAGKKSGLWADYARLIGELRPCYAIVENVATLLSRGLGRVLGGLAEIGYDAEWESISAAAVGAPHIRDRIWILCYPNRDGQPRCAQHAEASLNAPAVDDASCRRHGAPEGEILSGWDASQLSGWWQAEPRLDRVAYGLPGQVDRLKALGNAVVPQIAEMIGRAILEADRSRRAAA